MSEPRSWRDVSIHECEFSVRTTNQLDRWRKGLTLGDLDDLSDDVLLAVKFFGRKCLREVREMIANFKPLPPVVCKNADIVRVIRIIEYVGPRKEVQDQVRNSIHGTKLIYDGAVRLTAVTIGEFPESLQDYPTTLTQD